MKHLPTFLLLFFILNSLFIYSSPASAQNFNFTRAYNDYLYNYNQYRSAHAEYIAAKQQYLTYKTLTSKSAALEKTMKMLETRDETIRTYLIALRLKLAETSGISPYEEQIVNLRLNNEVAWFQEHKKTVSSAGTIEDLVNLSDEAQKRYQETEVTAYQTLGTILAGKEVFLRDKIQTQINAFEGKIAQIRQEGKMDTKTLERWVLEAQNRLTRSKEKQFAAQSLLAELKPHERNKGNVYSQSQNHLAESHQYLKEAHSYLLEIIRELKGD